MRGEWRTNVGEGAHAKHGVCGMGISEIISVACISLIQS